MPATETLNLDSQAPWSRSEEWDATEVEASSAMNVRPGRVAGAPCGSVQRTLNPDVSRHKNLRSASGGQRLCFGSWEFGRAALPEDPLQMVLPTSRCASQTKEIFQYFLDHCTLAGIQCFRLPLGWWLCVHHVTIFPVCVEKSGFYVSREQLRGRREGRRRFRQHDENNISENAELSSNRPQKRRPHRKHLSVD